jgi:hypothetical protein
LKTLLLICSATEAATGLALIVIPSIVTQLLLGVAVEGIALTISRLAGLCLISFGIACWPTQNTAQAARAMFIYNLIVAAYFAYYGVTADLIGIILWPVAILHFVFAVLLLRRLIKSKQSY